MSGRHNDNRLRERTNSQFRWLHEQVHPARSLRASRPLLTNPSRIYTSTDISDVRWRRANKSWKTENALPFSSLTDLSSYGRVVQVIGSHQSLFQEMLRPIK